MNLSFFPWSHVNCKPGSFSVTRQLFCQLKWLPIQKNIESGGGNGRERQRTVYSCSTGKKSKTQKRVGGRDLVVVLTARARVVPGKLTSQEALQSLLWAKATTTGEEEQMLSMCCTGMGRPPTSTTSPDHRFKVGPTMIWRRRIRDCI